jgi:hypothetical protein
VIGSFCALFWQFLLYLYRALIYDRVASIYYHQMFPKKKNTQSLVIVLLASFHDETYIYMLLTTGQQVPPKLAFVCREFMIVRVNCERCGCFCLLACMQRLSLTRIRNYSSHHSKSLTLSLVALRSAVPIRHLLACDTCCETWTDTIRSAHPGARRWIKVLVCRLQACINRLPNRGPTCFASLHGMSSVHSSFFFPFLF